MFQKRERKNDGFLLLSRPPLLASRGFSLWTSGLCAHMIDSHPLKQVTHSLDKLFLSASHGCGVQGIWQKPRQTPPCSLAGDRNLRPHHRPPSYSRGKPSGNTTFIPSWPAVPERAVHGPELSPRSPFLVFKLGEV